MSDTMDPKHIETIDNIVSGYNKVKTLYKENADMVRKLKSWFKEHRTTIIISVIVLGVVGFYVYRQYQESAQELNSASKKTTAVKEKTTSETQKVAEVVDVPSEN